MSIQRICTICALAGLMLAVCGCGKPNLSVYAATVAALKQLEIEVTETAKDVFYAKVVGRVADGRTITIRLEPGEDNVTDLSIKASKFLSGNEERSCVIYKQIQQNLRAGSDK